MKCSLPVGRSVTNINKRRVKIKDLSPIKGNRTLVVIIIAAAMAALCMPALAVEDGLGTNVVKNLRVKDGGTLSLGGTVITNWAAVQSNALDQTARAEAEAAQTDATAAIADAATAQDTATYGSNTANTAIADAVAAQAAATYGSNTANTAIADAVAAQATATYGSNTANAAQTTATYGSNTANSALANAATAQTDASAATNGLTLKYDKAGGSISGNVTFDSNTVYSLQLQVALTNNALISPANVSVVKIAGVSGAVTNVGIDAGIAGQMLTLIGTDDTKKVQIGATSANMVLTEGVDFTMGSNAVLQVIYTGAQWAETHRATP